MVAWNLSMGRVANLENDEQNDMWNFLQMYTGTAICNKTKHVFFPHQKQPNVGQSHKFSESRGIHPNRHNCTKFLMSFSCTTRGWSILYISHFVTRFCRKIDIQIT